jgi:predicted acyltransferase
MINNLKSGRILSIDAFRGITILVMIFVNSVSGISGAPSWMLHALPSEDRMTFVDVVFPAFLFIVGMSVPFGINARLAKGDSWWKLQGHIAWRTIGLLVLGIFMANMELVNAAATGLSEAAWSLLFYFFAIITWMVYKFKQSWMIWIFRAIGMAGIIYLGIIFRGTNGTAYLAPHWWGILGLIGKAYLGACIFYQLFKGRGGSIMLTIIVLYALRCLAQQSFLNNTSFSWMQFMERDLTHTAIVLSGVLLTIFYFDEDLDLNGKKLFSRVTGFLILILLAAVLLSPSFHISKNKATASWGLYSTAICIVIYAILYWVIEIKKISGWTNFFKASAANPLLTYILPEIVFYLLMLTGVTLPAILMQGTAGIIWSACYALLMLLLVKGLNKLGIRLQL